MSLSLSTQKLKNLFLLTLALVLRTPEYAFQNSLERRRLSASSLATSMGDSEPMVAETSAVMDYASAGYASAGYADAGSNVVPSAGAYTTEAAGDPAAFAVSSSSLGEGNAYSTDPRSVVQEGQISATNTHENVAGIGDSAVDPTNDAAYNSSLNGTGGTEAGNVTAVANGNAFDNVAEASAAPEFVDGSVPAMSGEEERLWSIVRANSLDFNAWTALIEETEKVAESNILKIRKVYDAFLAEFPLCYGYWKKYADHEARLGSMDKVVEVYERAVQGVTYSVDIWLLYCTFAIETYGDPETIRRCINMQNAAGKISSS